MKKLLFLFLMILPFQSVHAEGTVKGCFEDEDTDGGISMCLTLLNTEIEGTRKIIENDMLQMVENDIYVPPPKYEIDDTIHAYTPTEMKPKSPEDARAQANLERAMAKLRLEKIEQEKRKIMMKQRIHDVKKRDIMEQIVKSRTLFEEYRETECERHKVQIHNEDNLFESIYMQKICFYEMTMQRIKSLQKSIK